MPHHGATGAPELARLREICLNLPGAKEKNSHGSSAFYTTKIFCWWTAHASRSDADRLPADAFNIGFSFLPDPDERDALLADGRFYIPAYVGVRGWLAYDLSGRFSGPVDWEEVTELVESSYRNTAGKRLIAELDAR